MVSKLLQASSGCVNFQHQFPIFLATCIGMRSESRLLHSATGQEGEVHIYIPSCLNILVSSVLVFNITLPLADSVTVHTATLSATACVCAYISAIGADNNLQR